MDLEQIIPDALNQHIFDKIWNEPYSEFRENIHPILLTKRSVVGVYSTFYGNILLPTTDEPYFVYGLADADLCVKFPFVGGTWTSTDELCNKHSLMIHTYTYRGQMMHKSKVYFRYSADGRHLFMAIAADVITTVASLDDLQDIYFTVYYDSDIVHPITICSRKIPVMDSRPVINELAEVYRNAPSTDMITVYVNGYAVNGSTHSPSAGEYVDIIVDENVTASFVVDLTDPSQLCKYYSDKDKCYKYVVHIPKELNPEANVYTHNTCDMHVFPIDGGPGLYLHRCADLSVGQITHNDFSVPLYIVDAYRDHVHNQDVRIRVQIRKHDKDNILLRDKSYIDLLYTHDDEGILYFLGGNTVYPQLHFWSASELESSMYLRMMFDVHDVVTPANMYDYVEGLGYYHVLALICERIFSSVVTDTFARTLTYTKPYLYRGYSIAPALYVGDRKINHRYVRIIDDSTNTFTITISDEVVINEGQIMNMIMYLDGPNTLRKITPTDTNRNIPIESNDVRVYERIDSYVPGKYRGMGVSSGISYRDVSDMIGLYQILDGSIYCGDGMLHKTYVIQHEYCSYVWNEEIDHLVHAGENIGIVLAMPLIGSTERVPILNFKNDAIYLNGKYLIKGLDYHIHEVRSADGDLSFMQLIIQSFEYLVNHGNVVEIYLNIAELEDTSSGFTIHDRVYDMTPANLWFPSISVCHVAGVIEQTAINRGIHIDLPAGKYHNGAPFEVHTAVPEVVTEFLTTYHVNDDKARLEILNDYFYGRTPMDDGLILLPGSHRLYSVYLNRIIKDIIAGTFLFANDPESDRLKDQLADYDYLLEIDKVVGGDLDLNMVDIYPAYQQYATTAEKRMLIKLLISTFIPSSEVVAGGDFYE